MHAIAKQNVFENMIREAVRQVPSMPALCREAMEQVRNPNADFAALAEKMRADPGITMNVLKVANSSYFAGTRRVDSLLQAFVRLGSKRLFQIVLAKNVADRMAARLEGYEMEAHALLRHSLFVALTAETLARSLKLGFTETMFTCGLTHDIGKLVMDEFATSVRSIMKKKMAVANLPFDEIECDLFGITHAEAGALLMEEWRFPNDLTNIVRVHHRPESSPAHCRAAVIVCLADIQADRFGCGDGLDSGQYGDTDHLVELAGVQAEAIELAADQSFAKLDELEAALTC